MWCHFKVGSLEGNIRSWRWSLQDEISTLIKRDMQSCFLSHYQMKIQRDGLLWTRNLQAFTKNPTILALKSLNSKFQNCEKYVYCLSHTISDIFVTATQTKAELMKNLICNHSNKKTHQISFSSKTCPISLDILHIHSFRVFHLSFKFLAIISFCQFLFLSLTSPCNPGNNHFLTCVIDEMAGWHHQLNGHELEQTLGGNEGQGDLAWCSSCGCKELDVTRWVNNNNLWYNKHTHLPTQKF